MKTENLLQRLQDLCDQLGIDGGPTVQIIELVDEAVFSEES